MKKIFRLVFNGYAIKRKFESIDTAREFANKPLFTSIWEYDTFGPVRLIQAGVIPERLTLEGDNA